MFHLGINKTDGISPLFSMSIEASRKLALAFMTRQMSPTPEGAVQYFIQMPLCWRASNGEPFFGADAL